MKRLIQSLCFIGGLIFAVVGQAWIWELPNNDRLVPYLLTSIIFILVAIYLKGDGYQ